MCVVSRQRTVNQAEGVLGVPGKTAGSSGEGATGDAAEQA